MCARSARLAAALVVAALAASLCACDLEPALDISSTRQRLLGNVACFEKNYDECTSACDDALAGDPGLDGCYDVCNAYPLCQTLGGTTAGTPPKPSSLPPLPGPTSGGGGSSSGGNSGSPGSSGAPGSNIGAWVKSELAKYSKDELDCLGRNLTDAGYRSKIVSEAMILGLLVRLPSGALSVTTIGTGAGLTLAFGEVVLVAAAAVALAAVGTHVVKSFASYLDRCKKPAALPHTATSAKKSQAQCKPCPAKPPRIDTTGACHWPCGLPHMHYYVTHQSPPPSCKCDYKENTCCLNPNSYAGCQAGFIFPLPKQISWCSG
ncbi:MAG: hypothetical protein KC503_38150 [Myxococcales bacterium]|nr:hypothetical protein [Myxococcales bacterium]